MRYKISNKDHFWETAKLWHWNAWEVLSIVLGFSLHVQGKDPGMIDFSPTIQICREIHFDAIPFTIWLQNFSHATTMQFYLYAQFWWKYNILQVTETVINDTRALV